MRFHQLPSRHFKVPEVSKRCPGAGAIHDIHVSEVPEEEIHVLAEPFVAFRLFYSFPMFFFTVLFFKDDIHFPDTVESLNVFFTAIYSRT